MRSSVCTVLCTGVVEMLACISVTLTRQRTIARRRLGRPRPTIFHVMCRSSGEGRLAGWLHHGRRDGRAVRERRRAGHDRAQLAPWRCTGWTDWCFCRHTSCSSSRAGNRQLANGQELVCVFVRLFWYVTRHANSRSHSRVRVPNHCA